MFKFGQKVNRWVEELVKLLPKEGKVLDLGCGRGANSMFLAERGFVIQLPNMIRKFRKFFSEFSMELLLPVWNLDSDWERKNLLLLRRFVPKTLEPQCLIGVPLPKEALDKEIQKAVEKYFDKIVLPRARKIIITQSKLILSKRGEIL